MIKLTASQRNGLEQLESLRANTARNGLSNPDLPIEGLWWMPRDGRSISYQTVKSLHAKGLIERHPNRVQNFDWCRINDAGRETLASPSVSRPQDKPQ